MREPHCKQNVERTPIAVVIRFLDETFPEVGVDCPNFPVMVVMFSAALLRSTNVATLCAFTGYGRQYVAAIAENMATTNYGEETTT